MGSSYLAMNLIRKTITLLSVVVLAIYFLLVGAIDTEAVSLDPAYESATPSIAVSYCGGGPGDGRTYCRRNCTSYVAYKLATLGVAANQYQNNGNGNQWSSRAGAKNIPRGTTPKVGAVAYWNSGGGGYGHVGWVDSINADGSVNTSNYNGLTESFYRQNSARPRSVPR